MAWQRARAAEYSGAGGDPGGRFEHSRRRLTVARREAGYRTFAYGNARGEFQLGRFTGRSHWASREPRRESFARKHDARMQVEQDACGGKAGCLVENAVGKAAECWTGRIARGAALSEGRLYKFSARTAVWRATVPQVQTR